MGVVKLAFTVVCAHEEAPARKATVLQLNLCAFAHVSSSAHTLLPSPSCTHLTCWSMCECGGAQECTIRTPLLCA